MKITELSTESESESEIPEGERKYEINKSSKELLINSRKEKLERRLELIVYLK